MIAIEGFGPFMIEVKRDEKSKPRPSQIHVMNRLMKAGTKVYVIDSWKAWVHLRDEIRSVISQ